MTAVSSGKANRESAELNDSAASHALSPEALRNRNQAVTELFTTYRPGLIRWATTFVGPDAAEDVVHTVFLKLMKPEVFPSLRFETIEEYLYRAVHNAALSFQRQGGLVARNSRSIFDPDYHGPVLRYDVPSEGSDPAETVPTKIAAEQIWSLSLTLPAIHREVLDLRFHDDLTHKQIAQRLQTRVGTIFSRLFRGIEAIKEMLAA